MSRSCDILIIGAGAAGLFAATWAGRAARELRKPLAILAVDGETVRVDFNHPLAGREVVFRVQILSVVPQDPGAGA